MDSNLIVTIIFGVISTILTIITIKQGWENKRLNDQRQQVHNTAQTIIQNYNFQTLPNDIKANIQGIAANTSGTESLNKTVQNISIGGLIGSANGNTQIRDCSVNDFKINIFFVDIT